MTQPSILKDVPLSSLPVLHVVNIFRRKKHGGNILSQRLVHFPDCAMYCKYFEKKRVSNDVVVTRCTHLLPMVTASLRSISALCVLPVLPATSFSTSVMSVFSTCQPKTTSLSHLPCLVRFIELDLFVGGGGLGSI